MISPRSSCDARIIMFACYNDTRKNDVERARCLRTTCTCNDIIYVREISNRLYSASGAPCARRAACLSPLSAAASSYTNGGVRSLVIAPPANTRGKHRLFTDKTIDGFVFNWTRNDMSSNVIDKKGLFDNYRFALLLVPKRYYRTSHDNLS